MEQRISDWWEKAVKLGKQPSPRLSLYSRLDTSKKEIRVLRLYPIPSEYSSNHCWLSTITLEDGANFIPISYVWSDANQKTEIFVNGVSFQATQSLCFLSSLQVLTE